jgi:uncharacterized protein
MENPMSEIGDIVMAEPLFDCHEHQHGFTSVESDKGNLDYTVFLGYAASDMCTAAGGEADTSTAESFFRTWQFVRTTGYGRATEMACKELFGLDFALENAATITQALREFVRGKTGRQIYSEVFARANICGAICDACWECPTELRYFSGEEHPDTFGQALRYDGVICLGTREQVLEFEKPLGCSLGCLGDLDRALDEYAEKARQGGKLAALKCGTAYLDNLRFENASYEAADRVFGEIMKGRPVDTQPLKGYLFHRLVQRGRALDIPVQIHTGYLAGNFQNNLSNSDPTPLIPVFSLYPDVRFDLFHAGWPYTELMGAIGKKYPNTYLNLCWSWAMSPAGIERALGEWLASVPYNKILAFGADTLLPYVVPGYAKQARVGIARVLERKVESGEFDLPTARDVARRIMSENARELYRVG